MKWAEIRDLEKDFVIPILPLGKKKIPGTARDTKRVKCFTNRQLREKVSSCSLFLSCITVTGAETSQYWGGGETCLLRRKSFKTGWCVIVLDIQSALFHVVDLADDLPAVIVFYQSKHIGETSISESGFDTNHCDIFCNIAINNFVRSRLFSG